MTRRVCTTINRKKEHNIKPLQFNTQNCPAQPSQPFEIFTFLSVNTPSVWINSTVKATGDIFSLDKQQYRRRISRSRTSSVWINSGVIFSLDKQHYRRRTSRSRSIFSLDKQHCVEAGWLSIQVSVEKDFRVLIGRGYLISLLGEVRYYELLSSAHRRAELFYDWILRRLVS